MARITVEDCLERVPNRFSLVLIAAERTKQLMKGAKPLIDDNRINKNKEIVISLREIAAGQILADLSEFDENELLYGPAGTGAMPPELDGDDLMVDDDLPAEF